MAFEIEDGVPLPPRRWERGTIIGTLRQMRPGQSFFILAGRSSVSAITTRATRELGNSTKFTLRTVEENGVRGVRVWRVS